MDEKYVELASEQTESTIEAGLANARIKPERPDDFEGFCTCGEEIPEQRIALDYYNCVTCQSRKEGRGRFFAR